MKMLHSKGNFKILTLDEYTCVCVSFFKKLEPVFAILILKDEAKSSLIIFCLQYKLFSGRVFETGLKPSKAH